MRKLFFGCARAAGVPEGTLAPLGLLIAGGALATGCGGTSFDQVETSDIIAVIDFFAESEPICQTEPDHFSCQTEARVRLWVASPKETSKDVGDFEEFDGNLRKVEGLYTVNATEDLLLRAEGETQTLEVVPGEEGVKGVDGQPYYTAIHFGAPEPPPGQSYDPAAEFSIELLRKNDLDNALNNRAILPEHIDVTWPGITEFSRAADRIDFEWIAARRAYDHTTMYIEAEGDCIADYRARVVDQNRPNRPTTATVESGTLLEANGGGTCDVTFSVIRTEQGVLDTAFGGGQVNAHQVRTWTVTSKP